MASLPPNFERFSDNISLDDTRRNRIDGALSKLGKVVAGDAPMGEYLAGAPFPQGSYSYSTGIKPVKVGQEFDVDVVLPIDAARGRWMARSPDDVLNHLATRLRGSYPDQRVSRRNRCVRIDYAGEFHLDVVPGWQKDGIHYVPDRSQGSWVASNPAGLTAWVKQQNARSSMRMIRAVKFLKYWRDHRFGGSVAPKSILLTALIGYHANPMPEGNTVPADDDAGYLHNLVWALHLWAEKPWWKPSVANPSLSSEDLSANWSSEGWEQFKKRLGTLVNRVDDAYHEEDRARSARKWQEAFGDAFPAYVV